MGFLGRVASRAVGEATAARPRLAAPFGPREAVAPVGLEMLDLEAAGPASGLTRRVAAAASSSGASPVERIVEPRELDASPGQPPRREVARLPLRTAAKEAVPAAMSTSENERRDIGPRPKRGTSEPPSVAEVETEPVAAVPLARATPVAPAPVAHATVPVSVAAEEQPAVRVHIGRLEVRANLEQPLQQPHQRRESRRNELTLSDYLRGRQAR
jgi:hypothetical protein